MNTRKASRNTWVSNWVRSGEDRIATHGTCAECGGLYEIKGNGTLRRHSTTQNCYLIPQLPAEMIAAILLLAELQ